jgi:hypothetical protein
LQDRAETLGPGYLSKVGSFAFKTQGQSTPSLASVAARVNDELKLEIDVAASGAAQLYYVLREVRETQGESDGTVPLTPVEYGSAIPPTPADLKAIAEPNPDNPAPTLPAGVWSGMPSIGGTLTVPSAAIPSPLSYGKRYRLYAVVEGVAGGGSDSPAEFSNVVWSDVFSKTQTAPKLAENSGLLIEPIGWGAPVFGGSASTGIRSGVYDYTGINVPNTYKTIRVTPTLSPGLPATASIRVNGVTLPSVGYIDLSMPQTAGTPFLVKVEVSAPGAQTVSYTVLLQENVPAVAKLYVADTTDPNPSPDGNGNYEVRLQPSAGQKDVAVRIDIEPEMRAELIVNGNTVDPVLPQNAANGWQFTVPLNAASPTDVTIKVVGPAPVQEVRGYTLRINY